MTKLMLDLGCGSGHSMKEYNERGWTAIGIDIQTHGHGLLLSDAKKYGFPVKGDARQLPFKKNIFDLIVTRETLHHIPNSLFYIETFSEYLKSNGTFKIYESVENNPLLKMARKIHHYFFFFFKKYENLQPTDVVSHFTYEDIVEQLKRSGFKIINSKRSKLFNFIIPFPKRFMHVLDIVEEKIVKLIGTKYCAACEILAVKE